MTAKVYGEERKKSKKKREKEKKILRSLKLFWTVIGAYIKKNFQGVKT